MSLDQFKARLKAKTTAAGVNLSKERITAIADRLHKKFPELTEEADHDEKLDELNELTPFDEIARTDDKIRTLENKPKPKPEPDAPKPDPAPADDMPAWAKTLLDQNKALSERLQGFEKEKTVGSIKQQIDAKLKDKNIPAKFYEKWQIPEKADDVDAFAEEVEKFHSEIMQTRTEQTLTAAGTPPSGAPPAGGQKRIDPAIAGFVKSKQQQQTKN